jgi:ATPase subunit of ABC transporter with duplicated ATPase domains
LFTLLAAMSLVNIPVHTLAAGSMQVLHSAHNASGLDTSLTAHLRCNLRLKQGARHFLLGRNGCGKTTLLRAIASGNLEGWPQRLNVHLVDQDVPLDAERSALDLLLAADSEHVALEHEAQQLEELCEAFSDAAQIEAAGLRLCEIYDIIAEKDDGQRQRQAHKILSGLGFEAEKITVSIDTLSGGWRMRAMLAAALFMEPELLLLDEPTNHLDLSAISWLQRHLADEFPGTVLCVSHDRAFINAVADEIIVFTENRSLEYFSGSLDDLYKHAAKVARRSGRQDAARQKKIEQIEKKRDRLEQQVIKMESSLGSNVANRKYGNYQGTGSNNIDKASARVKKGLKKLEHLELGAEGDKPNVDPVSLQVIEDDDDSWAAALAPKFQDDTSALKFVFAEADPLNMPQDAPVLQLSAVTYRYHDCEEDVLTNIDLALGEKCRIAIVGRNGAGKSTLMNLICGQLAPTCGEIMRHQNLRIAYFGQHDATLMQQRGVTPLQYLEECLPKQRESYLYDKLIAFGITDALMRQPMAELSGGQRMCVAFARMCAEEPHLLVLDEPTNHLDIYAIEALSDALQHFQGGVVFVTHNRHLVEEVADSVIVVGGCRTKVQTASMIDKKRFNFDA